MRTLIIVKVIRSQIVGVSMSLYVADLIFVNMCVLISAKRPNQRETNVPVRRAIYDSKYRIFYTTYNEDDELCAQLLLGVCASYYFPKQKAGLNSNVFAMLVHLLHTISFNLSQHIHLCYIVFSC